VETGTGLKLNISENDNSLNLELAMDVIPYFRIKSEKALVIKQRFAKLCSNGEI